MAPLDHPLVILSALESERLGIKVARTADFTAADLPGILDFCSRNNIDLLVARPAADDLAAIHALERSGFLLMDAQIRFSRSLITPPPPALLDRIPTRPAQAGEEDEIRRLAEKAFRGYRGHYQENPQLSAPPAEVIYADWAVNALRRRDQNHDVLVAEREGKIVGFAIVRLNNPEEGESPLAGTDPASGRRSLTYYQLIVSCYYWTLEHGGSRFAGNVLLNNLVVAKLLIKLGGTPESAWYTFHKLFRL